MLNPDKQPASSAGKSVEAMARLKAIADNLAMPAPSRLIADDGGPDFELLSFCREHDVSLDWIFLGK